MIGKLLLNSDFTKSFISSRTLGAVFRFEIFMKHDGYGGQNRLGGVVVGRRSFDVRLAEI